jgi:S1-C subfamily serine protease
MSLSLASLSQEISQIVAKSLASTVTVYGESANLSIGGSGSGWVFDKDGHIVTNYHVVKELDNPIKVKPAGKPHLIGKLVGIDPETDLAVLSVPFTDLPALSLRQDQAILGEICIAIGSPLGLRESASLGIISGLARQSKHPDGYIIEEMLQTDSSVNPGNSGGPLIDVQGQLLGVNTLGMGETVNFAIPAETVALIVPELIEYGNVKRASLGISVAAKWTNVNGRDEELVEVRSIREQQLGLKEGDLLLSIDSRKIRRRVDVQRTLNRNSIGRRLPVEVLRSGAKVELEVIPKEKR